MTEEQPATVLVVDDEPLVLLIAAGMIEQAGWTALEAANSAEAIEILSTHPHIDLLFTDINMPGAMNGLELAGLVHERHPQVGLVITSGKGFWRDYVTPDHGAFLQKPYTYDELVKVLSDKLAAA